MYYDKLYVSFVSESTFHVLVWMNTRFTGWNVYTIDTADRQGPEFNGASCQVIHIRIPRAFNKKEFTLFFQYSC